MKPSPSNLPQLVEGSRVWWLEDVGARRDAKRQTAVARLEGSWRLLGSARRTNPCLSALLPPLAVFELGGLAKELQG